LKIADKRWSLTNLERVLRSQLAGQRLRRQTCKSGRLLFPYEGSNRFWMRPKTQKRLIFYEMVAYLDGRAKALEKNHQYGVRLAVFGLDLTAPYRETAHRNLSGK
jgi:hypothetical protein